MHLLNIHVFIKYKLYMASQKNLDSVFYVMISVEFNF